MMKKVSSHNKAMDRGLKPATPKPGRTNNTYIAIILLLYLKLSFNFYIEITSMKFKRKFTKVAQTFCDKIQKIRWADFEYEPV